MKVLELFSGIGGMHYALKSFQKDCDSNIHQHTFDVIAVDNNQNANSVYHLNFGAAPICKNVESLPETWFSESKFDILTMSPPCQPFTRLGQGKAEDDFRCEALLFIIERFQSASKPIPFVLMENVQGFEKSSPRRLLVEVLILKGFDVQEFILTPFQFGIPNSRPRYYLLAKRLKVKGNGRISDLVLKPVEKFNEERESESNEIAPQNQLEDQYHQCHPFCDQYHSKIKPLSCFLDETLNKNLQVAIQSTAHSSVVGNGSNNLSHSHTNYIILKGKEFVEKFHICDKDSLESSCFTKGYPRCIGKSGSILRVKTVNGDSYRYFTEYEISSLLGFPREFKFPGNISLKQRYALLGNSLCVPVVCHLLGILLSPVDNAS
ncbi:uncharacterized protein LOC142353700 [Convolutriloba macropyga]|uniref:uncharacterized protein LOC142353700 n=1 Tax=Convolutriloba macropyga TaxID=536237 RepID=UPI003F52279F